MDKSVGEYYNFHMNKIKEFHKTLSKVDFDTEDSMRKYMNSQYGLAVYNECNKNNINMYSQHLDYALDKIYSGYNELGKLVSLPKEDKDSPCIRLRELFKDLETRKIFVELTNEGLADSISTELQSIALGIDIETYKDVMYKHIISRTASDLTSAYDYGVLLVLEELTKACDDIYFNDSSYKKDKNLAYMEYVRRLIKIEDLLRVQRYMNKEPMLYKDSIDKIKEELNYELDGLRNDRNNFMLAYGLDAYNFHNYIHGENARMMRLVECSFKHAQQIIDYNNTQIDILSDFVRELRNL